MNLHQRGNKNFHPKIPPFSKLIITHKSVGGYEHWFTGQKRGTTELYHHIWFAIKDKFH
jgi:hypothetical protein